jgi:hypothetical protein
VHASQAATKNPLSAGDGAQRSSGSAASTGAAHSASGANAGSGGAWLPLALRAVVLYAALVINVIFYVAGASVCCMRPGWSVSAGELGGQADSWHCWHHQLEPSCQRRQAGMH